MPDVWNAAPVRSPVYMGQSNGNTPIVGLAFNTDLDNGNPVAFGKGFYSCSLPPMKIPS